jgi:hypothetical protein
MKLATPLYEGDSIIRQGPRPAETIDLEAHTTPNFVQRNSPAFQEIEALARAHRAVAVAVHANRFWRWLAAQFDGARRSHQEAYLAQSQSLAELERRMRELERGSLMRI